ncbi:MAG: hypothetical protein LW832_01340 [Parachlamydia sp.]|jgi:colicin import membrane protein|nr:hypothetical protein [Parachlamydia sp.]
MSGHPSFLEDESKSYRISAFLVLSLHVGLLGAAAMWPTPKPLKTAGQRVVVSTVALSPPVAQRGVAAPVKNEKTSQQTTLPKAVPVKTEKPKDTPKPPVTAVKKSASQNKVEPVKKKEASAAEVRKTNEIAALQEASKKKEKELLAKAKENFSKLGETRQQISKASSLPLDNPAAPSPSLELQIDSLPASGQAGLPGPQNSYHHEIALKLKTNLRLPDYGSVKIKLTLEASGKVTRLEVLSAESEKNRAYVEKSVASLLFPHFGRHFNEASEYTFFVTLNNE